MISRDECQSLTQLWQFVLFPLPSSASVIFCLLRRIFNVFELEPVKGQGCIYVGNPVKRLVPHNAARPASTQGPSPERGR